LDTVRARRQDQGRQLAAGAELEKVNAEIANYKQFMAHVDEIVEVNEAICETKPVSPVAGKAPPSVGGAEKRGSTRSSRGNSPPR
jgi:hypothetical protein